MSATYERLSKQYRHEVNSKLPAQATLAPSVLEELRADTDVSGAPSRILTARQIELTSMDATQLLQEIAQGRVTAVESVEAFGLRTAVAHQVASPGVGLYAGFEP